MEKEICKYFTKTNKKEKIKEMIAIDNEALKESIKIVYYFQTEDEKK